MIVHTPLLCTVDGQAVGASHTHNGDGDQLNMYTCVHMATIDCRLHNWYTSSRLEGAGDPLFVVSALEENEFAGARMEM